MTSGLGSVTNEERLEELGLFHLEKTKGDLKTVSKYPKGGHKGG